MNSLFQRYKVILSNFSYLSILEVLSLALPLITYPYLIGTLGSELYGVIIYAQTITSYLGIVINFGFNISATKDISINRDNKIELSRIVSTILSIKFAIFILLLIPYILIVIALPITGYKIVYLFSLMFCIQEVFFPTWFFQGIEKMKWITIITFSSKIVFLLLIFLIIHRPEDYIYVPIINGLGGIIGSLIAIAILKMRFGITFYKPEISYIKETFKRSIPFFLSRFMNIVSSKTNTMLVLPFLGYDAVAIYDLAIKIINILTIPFSLISQVLYPSIAKSKDKLLIKKSLIIVLGIAVIAIVSLTFLTNPIVNLLSHGKLMGATTLIYIMLAILPIIGCSYILGASTLVVWNYIKDYNKSVWYGFIGYIIYTGSIVLFNNVSLITLSIGVLIPEIITCVYRLNKTTKYKLI